MLSNHDPLLATLSDLTGQTVLKRKWHPQDNPQDTNSRFPPKGAPKSSSLLKGGGGPLMKYHIQLAYPGGTTPPSVAFLGALRSPQ